jgi:hypothetical protein
LDSRLKSYGVFKISAQVRTCSKPLWMQENLPKSAQNCQNLPKDETLKFCQKSRFYCFSKKKILCVEEALEHVSTVWIFNPRIFHMLFLLSKNGLCMWISAYPFVENNYFGNLPQLWWIWDFAHMYLTQLGTRMWGLASHI